MNKLIPVCEFRARNNPKLDMTTISIESVASEDYNYYYIAENGNRSEKYFNIEHAKEDIGSLYGKWLDFKFLI